MNKAINQQLELKTAEPVGEPPVKKPVVASPPFDGDDFSWGADKESIVIPSQPAIAVYFNPRGEVVIRQEGRFGLDEDRWIYIQIENLDPLIDILQRIAEREIEPS
jgi:hypothetical protein